VFKGQPEGFYNIDDLINEHGLREHILIKKDMHNVKNIAWFDILNAKGFLKRIAYLRSIMRSGFKLESKPRIEVSTIHASKGGERQKVMLLTDLSMGPYKSYRESIQGRDDEARVFYVGATRAKEELYVIHRVDMQHEYEPIFHYDRKAS